MRVKEPMQSVMCCVAFCVGFCDCEGKRLGILASEGVSVKKVLDLKIIDEKCRRVWYNGEG